MTNTSNTEIITRTKLYRPPMPRDHVQRHSLLSSLGQYPYSPLTLVSAPAGYGKSTLVSRWLGTCNVPSTWVSLDENDNDLRIFITYFIAAIQNIFPTACQETLKMAEVTNLPSVSALVCSLINALDRIEKAFIVVLDDYHFIRNQGIHELLIKLLEHPPAFMHLVLISRHDPPFPLHSMRGKGKLMEIRTQDLRFSVAETELFLQQATGVPVDGSVAALLEQKTEGWITGLRLAALSSLHRKESHPILTDLLDDNRYIFDYTAEIISQQPFSVQKYLVKTCILNRFCPSLCDAVCNSEGEELGEREMHGSAFTKLLDNTNLFVIPLDNGREWFRYHHLFQDALKRLLENRLGADDINKLHSLASVWFAENGYIEEALSHALTGGDKEAAAILIQQHRHAVMNRGQWYRLSRWLQEFSLDFIEEHPDLLLAKAWEYQRQARYSKLFDILDQIEQRVPSDDKESSTDQIFWGEVQTLRGFQYFNAARHELSEASARDALAKVPAQFHSVYGFALLVLVLTLQMRGDSEQARTAVYDALQQEEASISTFKSMLLAALCCLNWISADLNRLEKTAAQLLQHGQKHGLPESIAVGRFFSGILFYKRNNLEMAEHFLAPVVSEQAIPSIINYCQSSFALTSTYQSMGREQEAGTVFNTTTDLMLETGNADLLALCEVFQIELALRQGRIAEANYCLHNYKPAPLSPAFRFFTPHLTKPRVLLAKGTPASLLEAGTLLTELHDFYLSIHCTCMLIEVLILQALLQAALGSQSEALEKLEESLALAEPGGFVRPFLDQGPAMADLLSCLLKQHPDLKYAGQIYEAFESEKGETATKHSEERDVLRPSLSEEFLITPLSNREIEVLKMLDRGVSNNEIAEILHISPETVKRHLSTIYHKLKVKNRQQAVIRGKSIGIL